MLLRVWESVSKIDIQEKTAELIRSKVNIGALKQMANNEDRIRELKNLQAILGAQKVDAQGNTDTSSIDNLLSDIKKEQKALAEGKSTSGSTNADYASRYSAAVSSYNSNQGALNKSKEELENAGKDMQAGISDITKGMLGGGSTLVTNLMAAKENKGTMTGNCYLGDPEGGGTLSQKVKPKKYLGSNIQYFVK